MKDYVAILRAAIELKATQQNLKQTDIAKNFGLTQSQVSKILAGAKSSLGSIETIAEGIGVTFSDLAMQAQIRPESEPESRSQESFAVWANHMAAQGSILERIQDSFYKVDEVDITVIAVSLSFTWEFLIEKVFPLMEDLPQEKRLNVELGFVDSKTLVNLNIANWKDLSLKVKSQIEEFVDQLPDDSRITISAFTYDNLPHWHGLLINSTDLYLGRTKWWQNGRDNWILTVGQETYRHYSADKPGATDRINMFRSWFNWYRSRGQVVRSNRKDEAKRLFDLNSLTKGR